MDPLDVAVALRIGRGAVRKMKQNVAWAVGCNAVVSLFLVPVVGLVLGILQLGERRGGSTVAGVALATTRGRTRTPA